MQKYGDAFTKSSSIQQIIYTIHLTYILFQICLSVPGDRLSNNEAHSNSGESNDNLGVARTLKKLRTSKAGYYIRQRFSTVTSLFNGNFSQRKEFAPRGSEYFL